MISQEHELDSGLVQIETEKQAKGVRRDEMMMPPFFSVCGHNFTGEPEDPNHL
jgi:hypothetical protein